MVVLHFSKVDPIPLRYAPGLFAVAFAVQHAAILEDHANRSWVVVAALQQDLVDIVDKMTKMREQKE